MSEKIYLGRKVKRLRSSPEYGEYTKVRMITGDNTYVEAGDDTGLTLEVECPFATTAIAQSVLNSISGYRYRPYEAESARLEPDAEIGDGITTAGFYGGIYQMRRRFGRHSTANISAPQNSEADHEVQYRSEQERKFTRKMKEVNAEFAIKMDKVYTQVTSENNSFGWELTDAGMVWKSNGSPVMTLKDSGLSIKGTLEANSVLTGDLFVGGVSLNDKINAATLRSGANSGYNWASGYYGSSGLTNWGYSLTYANNYDNATTNNTRLYPAYFKVDSLNVMANLWAKNMSFDGNALSLQTRTIGGTTIAFVGWGY